MRYPDMKVVTIAILSALFFTCVSHAGEVSTKSISSSEESALNLTLKECLEMGLANNTDILKAKENVRKSQAELLRSFSEFFPNIYLNYNYTETSSPEAGRVADDLFLYAPSTGSINIEQYVFKGGERYYGYRKARYGLEKERESYKAKRSRIIYEITEGFYSLLLVDRLLVVNEEAKNRMESYTSVITNMSKVGDIHKYEILRAKVETQNVGSDIIRYEEEREIIEAKMKKLLMVPGSRKIFVKGSLSYPEDRDMVTYSVDSAAPIANSRNLSIKVAKLSKNVGKEEVSVNTSKYAPSGSIRGSFYKTSNKFNFMSHYFYNWALLVNVQLPIFDGFRKSAIVSQSMVELSKAEIEERFVREEIYIDLKESITNLERTKKLLSNQRGVSNDAENALNMAFTLYRRGDMDETNVIDSHNNYMAAQTNLWRFIRDYYVLAARIKYLMSDNDEFGLDK